MTDVERAASITSTASIRAFGRRPIPHRHRLERIAPVRVPLRLDHDVLTPWFGRVVMSGTDPIIVGAGIESAGIVGP